MENGEFIQISTATLTQTDGQIVMMYALGDLGNVWKCKASGQAPGSKPK